MMSTRLNQRSGFESRFRGSIQVMLRLLKRNSWKIPGRSKMKM